MNTKRWTFSLLLLICVAIGGILYYSSPLSQRLMHSVPSMSFPSLHLASFQLPQGCEPPAPTAPHALAHCPTVTAAFLDHVLTLAHSPSVGLGTVLYEEGVKYGIDPAYALAFYHHESDYGRLGVARVTLSLGNIRCTAGYRCIEGYRAYASYAAGVLDWYTLIANVYLAHGLTTVEQIIPVYAPSADNNNEAAYIAGINADVAIWREGRV